ncbi:helix-turn-helix domain-containing protein [Streptomyces mirabilis]|uniref:helix-turn-helix domain-containing protein n=1 Tax=Streptomyces mirabilis TaxID=68239 RepID=UPI00143E727A|nr:helix-turn-helix transcriptional regulator [Streptomyces sp. S1D4-11]QIY99429.1 helix-turn-helix transcriptional regulator [Streptomyces sp. S1D4-11]
MSVPRIRLHANRLRDKAREVGDESNYAIAQRAGVPESTLSRLLTGRTTPSADTLVALSDAYGITVDDLLQRPERKQVTTVPAHVERVPA